MPQKQEALLKNKKKSDPFFTKRSCDRCGGQLDTRIMSWFNEDCLCGQCYYKEAQLKNQLRKQGEDVGKLEGCGYIPEVK